MSTENVERLARNRHETRFKGTTEPDVRVGSGFQEVLYPQSVTSSLYFGNPNVIPDRGSIRFRFHSAAPTQHDIHVFDPAQTGTLEVKLRNPGTDEDTKTRKYSISDIPLATVIQALSSKDSLDQLADYPSGDHVARMIDLLYQGNPLGPVGMIQADRRHFVKDANNDAVRVTVDSDTSYWLTSFDKSIFYKRGILFARRAFTEPEKTLEIKETKSSGDIQSTLSSDIIAAIVGPDNDYTVEPERKRAKSIELFEQLGQPTRINPEAITTDGESYVITEREQKIDIGGDPRPIVESMSMHAAPDIYVGPSKPNVVYIRYIRVNDSTVVVEKSLSPDFDPAVSGFQYKSPVSADGVSVREEVSARTLDDLLTQIGVDKSGDSLAKSEVGTRNRTERAVVCADTGNIFTILADHCTASDDRPPLDQIEIEYQGRLDFPKKDHTPLDPDEIAHDFGRITTIVQNSLIDAGVQILPGQTTKEAWLIN